MATFHDSALGDDVTSGTTLSTADALAVTAGDILWAECKWETTTGATCSVDTGAATPTWSIANVKRQHGTAALLSATFYTIATTTGTINPRMVLSSAADFRVLRTFSVTPATGKTLQIGNVAAADGNSTSPSSGAAAAAGAGASFCGIALFGSRAFTPGTNWTEPGEFNISAAGHAEYQLQSGSGNITGDGSYVGSVEWISQLAIFNEVALGGARRPDDVTVQVGPTGGVPMAASPSTYGKSPAYGAVNWQRWEAYPWGAAAAVAVQVAQPFALYRTTPRLQDEPEEYKPQAYSLHFFRQTFQTVGQPWHTRYRPVTHRQEPDEYDVKPVNQAILFGRTTPAAPTAGQPWYLWPKTRRLDDADDYATRAVDQFLLLYGRPQIIGTRPFTAPPQPQWRYVPFEAEEYPQPTITLHLFRHASVQVGQPWALLFRQQPPPPADDDAAYQPRPPSNWLLTRTTPSAVPGQPWYMWRPWPLKYEDMVYVEPYDVPPFNTWMIERNIVPIIPPPQLTGSEIIIRSRRRRGR